MNGMVPARLLQELLNGSYEQTVQAVRESIEDSFSRFGAGSPEDVHLVATFPRHAIIANEHGEFFRVETKDLDDGTIGFVQVESFDVPILRTWEEQQGFIESTASDAVHALMSGDFAHAREQIKALVQSSDVVSAQDPVVEANSYLENLFDDERPWRRVYGENRTFLHRYLWGASGVAYRDAPKPKYDELYTSDGVELAEQYHIAVSTDLGMLSERLDKIWDRIADTYGSYGSEMSGFKDITIAGMAENFESFAADFVSELRAVHGLVEQAAKDDDPATVIPRALIYDRVSRAFPDIEIAAKLVQRAAVELTG